MKIQISKSKFQTNFNVQNSKFQTVCSFGNWHLRFVWNLVLGICNLFGYWKLVIGYLQSGWRLARGDSRGQGLLEAVISLAIIGTGVIGVMNLVISNQTGSFEAAERLVAANLAREGVEIVRNYRDRNWLARAVWDSGLYGAGNDYTAALLFDKNLNSWTLDFVPNDLNHDYARLWREGGVYFQSTQSAPAGATLTQYRRLLTLDAICQNKTVVASGSACAGANPKAGIRVRSEVQWTSRGSTHNLAAEERLFNWR